MRSQTLARWMLSVVLAMIMLGVWLLALNQAPISQSHALSTDYTVGGVCGATIQACINNPIVQAGDRILIPAGTYNASITLNKAVSLIGANANTTVIRALSNQRVMTVTGATITNSVVISGLTFTGGNLGVTTGDCPADCGAGLFIINNAQPLLYNTIMTGNSAVVGGGALYAASSTALSMTNVQVSNNSGGVYALGPLTVNGSTFIDNEGTGLLVENDAIINRTSFISNTYGGARISGTATLIDSWFENNRKNDVLGGSGLLVMDALTATGTVFVNNQAFNRDGGGAAVYGRATLNNCQFIGNQATNGNGGGLYASTLQLNHTRFVSNFAEFAGGGLRADGVVTIVDSYFENNIGGRVFGSGGGLAAYSEFMITGTQFISNSTIGFGGAIYHGNLIGLDQPIGDGRIVNTIFARNEANNTGAALYLNAGGTDVILHSTIADTEINPKQAIAVMTGTVGITDTIITSHTVAISLIEGTGYQDYNLLFGNTDNLAGAISGGTHNAVGDPLFVDIATDNYHITSGSAAKDSGINVGVLNDLDGLPRPLGSGFDIGAYEYFNLLNHIYLPLVAKNH